MSTSFKINCDVVDHSGEYRVNYKTPAECETLLKRLPPLQDEHNKPYELLP